MRLGQLAKTLETSRESLLILLEKEFQVILPDNPNTKIKEEHVRFLHKELLQKESPMDNIGVATDEKPATEKPTIKGENNDALPVDTESIPIIKAPKISLKGVKVVDKITLPEPPPPEMIEIDGVIYEKSEWVKKKKQERKEREEKLKEEVRKKKAKVRKRKTPERKEPKLTFAEKRAKEALKEKQQKEKLLDAQRKAKKRYYEKKQRNLIKQELKTKSKQEEPNYVPQEPVRPSDTEKKTTSLFGRIWKWLTTY